MNLEDLIDEKGLQQDEWSLLRLRFGQERQLEVVGWSGRSAKGKKLYIVKCAKCFDDAELFGDGHFKIHKGSLILGVLPCGCSQRVSWSGEQYLTLCLRKSDELGYDFLGFEAENLTIAAKIRMLCEKHGEWATGSIGKLLHRGSGCPGCASEARAATKIKSNEVMTQSFFASGAFHPETKFWRSERKNSQGAKVYWCMYCPICEDTGEATSSGLQQGKLPCACSNQRQKEGYINLIVDDHNQTVALKFGVARDSSKRARQQNLKSSYEIREYRVYEFPTVNDCKSAERDCKQQLCCGVILPRDMPDGYTETTSVLNLSRIEVIYVENGGLLKEIS